jgi:hypothetical protein
VQVALVASSHLAQFETQAVQAKAVVRKKPALHVSQVVALLAIAQLVTTPEQLNPLRLFAWHLVQLAIPVSEVSHPVMVI